MNSKYKPDISHGNPQIEMLCMLKYVVDLKELV